MACAGDEEETRTKDSQSVLASCLLPSDQMWKEEEIRHKVEVQEVYYYDVIVPGFGHETGESCILA